MKKGLLKILLLALVIAGTCVAVQALRSQEKKPGRDQWTWINADNDRKIEVKVESKVEFNEDYTDVASVADDGALRIYDSRGPQKFHLIITASGAGELKRDYSVDGQSRSFDAEGREWFRKVLLQAVREGGLDARNRVQRILKQRGVRGLTDEIGYLKGDYVRRIYFEALLQAPGINTQELRAALQNASNTIKGDYERSQLLKQVANVFLANNDLVSEYFAAASKIGSDYEKARLLISTADRFQTDPQFRSAWLNVARTIHSDYEHHRALRGVLKTKELSTEALSGLVASATSIESDYEKASFLIEALNHYRDDARLRAAFKDTAKTIGSEYERGRVQKRFDNAGF
jgi:hypothetical protein